jgi:hypothetical protein
MKNIIKSLVLLLLFQVCIGQTVTSSSVEICWKGTINTAIPVAVHYQIDANVVVGEITYLKTKNKRPIKLVGTIEEGNQFCLFEFDTAGNVTGIITGTPTTIGFDGNWFSPKTRKTFNLKLNKSSQKLKSVAIGAGKSDLFGNYHFQFGADGYQGDLKIKKLKGNKVEFSILGVTGEPSRNIANLETTTIAMLGNRFKYKIPETDNCEVEVVFYKDFATVNYSKGSCEGQFGHNATLEGVFLKVK